MNRAIPVRPSASQVAHAKAVGLDATLEAQPRFGWGRAAMADLGGILDATLRVE